MPACPAVRPRNAAVPLETIKRTLMKWGHFRSCYVAHRAFSDQSIVFAPALDRCHGACGPVACGAVHDSALCARSARSRARRCGDLRAMDAARTDARPHRGGGGEGRDIA